jgi:branched-chain amino acid transport system substrate-binding protein
MSIRLRTGVILGAAAALALTACGNANQGNSSSGAANEAGEISIGVSGPLTGPNAGWGVAMQGGAEMAAKDLQKKGGVKIGDKTYNFKIVAYDDQFNPQGASAAINRMVSQDGIKFVLGPTTGAAVAAVQPIVQSNKVVQLQSGFGKVVSSEFDYSFRTVLTPAEYCVPWYKWVAQNKSNVKKLALLGPNDVVGQGSVKPCEAAISAAGLTSQAFYYERSTQDYAALVNGVLAAKPDAIDLTGAAPGEAAGLVKQLTQSGFTGLIMKSGGTAISTIVSVAGDQAARGQLYFEQASESASPEVATFLKDFTTQYKSGEKSIAITYHDSLMLLAEAMKKAGSTDPTKVQEALHNDYDLPLVGKVTWGGKQTYGTANQLLGSGNIVEWDGKSGKVVGRIEAVSP